MDTIIFATGNAHKVQEVAQILEGTDIKLQSLKDIGWTTDIVEDGTTFNANAYLKAKALYDAGHTSVISEDSGIVVDALNGAPGIYSARYAGEGKSQADNNALLVKNLVGIDNRKAHFHTSICWIRDGEVCYFVGNWHGVITTEPYGNGGFGYDPLFVPDGYTKTVAELGDDVKKLHSHRAKAFAQFKAFLLGE